MLATEEDGTTPPEQDAPSQAEQDGSANAELHAPSQAEQAAPAQVEEVAPIEEAAPVLAAVAAPIEEAAPAQAAEVAASEEAAPAHEEVAPIEEAAPPQAEEAAPTEEAPAQAADVAASEEAAPAHVEVAPVEEAAPAQAEVAAPIEEAPAHEEVAPIEETAPAQADVAAAVEEAAPTQAEEVAAVEEAARAFAEEAASAQPEPPPPSRPIQIVPSQPLEQWTTNETMRHIPTLAWMAQKLDHDLRHRIDRLWFPYSDLPASDPQHAAIEGEFRALCRALERVSHVAVRHRGGLHPPNDLGSRIGWLVSHAVQCLNTADTTTFGRRMPFHLFERSNAEPLWAAMLTVIQHVQELTDLVRAIDPGIDERMYEELVQWREPLRREPMA